MNCAACGLVVPDGARFCPSCGHAVLGGRGDERRVVTVLFADLVGFTALSETRDPEQVKRLVDSCFEVLVADVLAFGGRLDKFVGDAIIALFGAPVAHEDDAERAVRAALRMQSTLRARAASVSMPLQMRIGVNTGEVLVGALRAGGDYTAMGDVVNAAERLQTAAAPGEVLVGPSTHASTATAIGYEALGLIHARGREEPIEAWRAIEPVAPPGRRRRRVKAPFVGRDTELALLLEGTRLAVAHHRPFLAVIEGEGGVGKSRLTLEAIDRARSKYGATVLAGRCMPYGEASAWHPLAAAIRTHVGLERSTEPGTAHALVTETVGAVCAGVAGVDVERTAIGLLHLLGGPTSLDRIDPARAHDELTHAVLTYLRGLARSSPLLVTLADVDWAEPALLLLLERALAHLTGLPFMLFTTARPGADVDWPPPPGRHNTLLLRVDALERAAADDLARALLPGETEAAVRRVLDRAGGNPLFLEELAVAVTESPTMVELPDTLRGLVAARLDRLDPASRAVLDNAAILGPSGTWEMLEQFGAALNQDVSLESLAALVDAELLDVDGDRWAFRSESVRDVVYQTLTKMTRAQRHAGVAHAIDEQTAGSDIGADKIAYHYAAAARLVHELGPIPGVRDDVGFVAAGWYGRAAARALEAMAPRRAVQLATTGLGLLGPADRLTAAWSRLLQVRARAFAQLREVESARADATSVLEGGRRTGDLPAQAQALTLLGDIERQAGRFAEARDSFRNGVALWEEQGNAANAAYAQRGWGFACLIAGDFAEAETHLDAARRVYAAERDRRGLAWVSQHKAWISFVQGDIGRAEERLLRAAATFRELGDHGGLTWVHGLLAFVRFHQGRFEEAEALAREVGDDASRRDERWGRGMMLALQASLRLWTGHVAEAIALGEESRALLRGLEDHYGEALAVAPLSRALVAAGRVHEAEVLLEERRADADVAGMLGSTSVITAGTAVHAGDGARAAEEARLALGDLERRDADAYDATVTLALALLQEGDVGAAAEAADRAVERRPGRPYGTSVAALVALASDRPAEGVTVATPVTAASGATYFDTVLALIAVGLGRARLGESEASDAALARAVRRADDAGDRVLQAVTRLAAAEADVVLGRDDAAGRRRDALARFVTLSLPGDGWITAIAQAARGGASLAPVG